MIKHNLERGFYQVGNKIFTNKMLALYEASTSKIEPKFNFHDETYSQLNWTLRPVGTLRDLYKQRAQQLRDEYDYITINFSGGPDSWNVLNSFLSNNIKVDEIYTRWGLAERKFTAPNNIDLDERNTGSEFEYAVLPVLNYLKKTHPSINIVVDDISECFQTELTEKKFLDSDQYQMSSCFFHTVRQSDKEKQAEKNNQKIGVVYGYDKINCKIVDGNFYAYFNDGMCGGDATRYNSNRKFECFYWSPNFPYIPILQAHYIKDFLKNDIINEKKFIFKNTPYRKLYMHTCYPEYNKETFQTKKMLGSIVSKSDLWIGKYNSRYFRSWKWHVDQCINSIDEDYISYKQNVVVGLKNFRSKDYLIESNCKLPDIFWERQDCLPNQPVAL
jgi:hypothetical protein